MTSAHLQERLAALAAELEPDALMVLVLQAERLLLGRRQYGDLDIANDARNWTEQALEEALDMNSYLTIALLKRRP